VDHRDFSGRWRNAVAAQVFSQYLPVLHLHPRTMEDYVAAASLQPRERPAVGPQVRSRTELDAEWLLVSLFRPETLTQKSFLKCALSKIPKFGYVIRVRCTNIVQMINFPRYKGKLFVVGIMKITSLPYLP
jgi:hypothetical protein